MKPWERLASVEAADGTILELRRRGTEYLIAADVYQLMSSEDEPSSRSLGELGCRHISPKGKPRVLIGGLGMGFTARAALDACGPAAQIDIAELIPAVVDWNREILGDLAGRPLEDARVTLEIEPVQKLIRAGADRYDAILLDVDNGPDFLAHEQNSQLYSTRGIAEAWRGLRPGGVLGVWSFSDDAGFTRRLERQGFTVDLNRVEGSRKGRGRYHWIWIARRPR